MLFLPFFAFLGKVGDGLTRAIFIFSLFSGTQEKVARHRRRTLLNYAKGAAHGELLPTTR